MRIESSTYSRNMINSLPQQQTQNTDQTRVQNQKQVEKPQQTAEKSTVSKTNTASLNVSLSNLPKSLDEVISPEEKGMLNELFPGNGGNWGVGAYKMSSATNLSYSLGAKLDLTT